MTTATIDQTARRAGAAEPEGRRGEPQVLLWIVLGAGTILRLIQYFVQRSLWIDEARLVLNIAGRSFGQLMTPLSYDQAAPIPFLWAERAIGLVAGFNELSLRAVAMVAGIALPYVVWRLGRRLLGPTESLIATAVVAFSPMLIRYSNEAKPYSLDALTGAVILLLAVRWAEEPGNSRRWWGLLVGGLLALLISFPAILVLAGVGGGLLFVRGIRTHGKTLARLLLAGGLWVAAFGVLFLLFYRAAVASDFLNEFWEFAFLRPSAPDILQRVWSATTGVTSGFLVGSLDSERWGSLVMTGIQAQGALTCLGCLIGGYVIYRRVGFWATALLGGPLLVTGIASATGHYPITIRLILFTAPSIFLLLAAAVVGISRLMPERLGRVFLTASVGFFLLPALLRDGAASLLPIRQQDTRPVIRVLERRHLQGEPIYIYSAAVPAWTFYSTDWSRPDTARLKWIARQSSSGGPSFPGALSRGHRVVGEGEDLVWHSPHHTEIIGVSTGRPLRWGGGGRSARNEPDSGWAENEARRIRALARPSAWVLFMPIMEPDYRPNLSQLQHALAALGGKMIFEYHAREADVFQYRFATPDTASGPPR